MIPLLGGIGLLSLQLLSLIFLTQTIAIIASTIIFFCAIIGVNYIYQNNIKLKKRIRQLKKSQDKLALSLDKEKKLLDKLFFHNETAMGLTDLNGKLIQANNHFCNYFGFNLNEILQINIKKLIYNADAQALQDSIKLLCNRKIAKFESEQRSVSKENKPLWMIVTLSLVWDENEQPLYYLVQVYDIEARKEHEKRLQHLAYHDPLTGLANRNKLEQFINHLISSSIRHNHIFSMLMLDLDNFKNINDTFGHGAGDVLLKTVAGRLQSAVRDSDMVGRLAGDEFVLLLTDIQDEEKIVNIAKKILDSILDPILINEKEIYITTSIGISMYPSDGENIEILMKHADLALYKAKELGRNNFQFYKDELTKKAAYRITLQNAIAHALLNHEFELYYQPKMSVGTRSIVGVEAFLRWSHPEFNTIKPPEIIKLAEEKALIIPLNKWIMETSCLQLKKWHLMGLTALTMSINCSENQFKHGNFVNSILEVLKENDLPANSLLLEVTENIIMSDRERIVKIFNELKNHGVKIVVDDFGAGYWSYANLQRLLVDEIKIDRSFISLLPEDEVSAAIIGSIIVMANKLGIKTIAEGVENQQQYDYLAKEGCTEIQGYYITKPLMTDEMTYFLMHPIPNAEVIAADKEQVR